MTEAWRPIVEEPDGEAFMRAYARRSGVSVQWLRDHGREPRRCYCDDETCEGWRLARVGEP